MNFRNCVIILTSNVGTDTIMRMNIGAAQPPRPDDVLEAIRPELNHVFKPAFIGRMAVVPFYPVKDEILKRIIELKLAKIKKRIAANHRAEFAYDGKLVDAVAARCTEVDSGARNVDNILNGTLLPEISESVLSRMGTGEAVTRISVGVDEAGKFTYAPSPEAPARAIQRRRDLPLFSDDNRLLKLTTPLGKDALLVLGFKGTERVSGLFEFVIDLVGERASMPPTSARWWARPPPWRSTPSGTADKAPGQAQDRRCGDALFVQWCRKFSAKRARADDRLHALHDGAVALAVEPDARLRQPHFPGQGRQGYRRDGAQGARHQQLRACRWPPRSDRTYCVQFAETDFGFVARLLEDEGIYYYFDHDDSGHSLKISDTKGGGPVCGPAAGIKFRPGGHRHRPRHRDHRLARRARRDHRQVRPEKLQLRDPGHQPAEQRADHRDRRRQRQAGAIRLRQQLRHRGRRHHPRQVPHRGAGSGAPALLRYESNCSFLIAGRTFKLADHIQADQNTDYMLLEVEHRARNNNYGTFLGGGDESYYNNRFECMRKDVQYRPPLVTPRPRMHGVQSAVVVGPQSEEIYTDKYGRIKVQFYWDRLGQKNESSSCWMRVAQSWASNLWGAQFIPRVGQEVLIDFVDGDPDRPVVTGALYNAQKMPPYALPDNKTQSGVKSRSSAQGGVDNFNELRFEDKKGSEDVNFQAEKDFHRLVKNDDSLEVRHDQTIKIKNARTETVDEGDETVTISKGKRVVTIAEGDESLTVSKGNRLVAVARATTPTRWRPASGWSRCRATTNSPSSRATG